MARKSIFELLNEERNIKEEIERVDKLFEMPLIEAHYSGGQATLTEFANRTWFRAWKSRGRFIDADDFLSAVGYKRILKKQSPDANDLLTIIEIVCNLIHQTLRYMGGEYGSQGMYLGFQFTADAVRLSEILQDELSFFGYKSSYDEDTETNIIIERKPEATAVAEIVPPTLAKSVLRYNQFTLKGDIGTKKTILHQIGDALEPQRKALAQIENKLSDRIFWMLNNLNIRHNNVTVGNKSYVAKVAAMSSEELEAWYDDLYQMMLLAFLKLDNVERMKRTETLRNEITGGTNG